MEILVDIAGFIGAWLLVAGPIFQSSLELKDQDIEFERIHEIKKSMPTPERVSAWWWLVPPVRIYLAHQNNDKVRHAYANAMTDDELAALFDYRSRALGWVMVAGGGLMLAIKETYEVLSHFDLPVYAFWVTVIAMAYISVSYTIISGRRRSEFNAQRSVSANK